MLKDDGERFLPWMTDPVISYEHLHRYRAARDLATGGSVLDMASGEGYGSALLAEVATSVIGIDIDREAVIHAVRAYRRPGLRFLQGSITEIPLASRRFDLAVCFEALEHVEDQEGLCREAARLLKPGGVFMVSTPNRKVYSEASGYRNPFHLKELYLDELTALVGRHFSHAHVFGQHVYPVSALFRLGRSVTAAREYQVTREAGQAAFGWAGPERKAPRYFLCVASDSSLEERCLPDSFLLDASEQLFEVQRRAEGAAVELQRHLSAREAQVEELETRHGAQIRALEADLAARGAQAEELDRLLRERGEQAQELARQVEFLHQRIAAMEGTRTWRLHLRAEALRQRVRRLRGGDAPASPGQGTPP